MRKKVLSQAATSKSAILIAIGWITFVLGTLAKSSSPVFSLCLLAIARVLP